MAVGASGRPEAAEKGKDDGLDVGGGPALLLPLMESVNAGDVVLPANDVATLGVTPRPLARTIADAVTE